MKKSFLIVILFFAISFSAECPVSPLVEGPVSYYGKLKVRTGTSYIDGIKENRADVRYVQIRGVSFFWSQWTDFYNENAVERMAKDWKAEVVRAAYSPTSVSLSDNADNLNKVKTVIEAAIKNDIYIIIDWHSHYAHSEEENAKEFFAKMAETYGSCDNVIFELFNEPLSISWSTIKDYAESVIEEIREYSDNLILVGTPNWSQNVDDVINDPISYNNVGYVLHFYASSHSLTTSITGGSKATFQKAVEDVIRAGYPIFVTEYGTTHSDGGCSPLISTCDADRYDTHNANRSNDWHIFLDQKVISSAAWSVHDKYEGSAFFGTVPVSRGSFDQTVEANWTDTTKMTASGKYIFKKLNEYYTSARWNPNATPILSNSANLQIFEPAETIVYSLSGKKIGALADINLKNGIYILISKQNGVMQRKILKIVK